MSNRLVEQIDKQIAIATAHSQTAEATRNDLSIELIRDPGNKTLHTQIADLETEIAAHNATVARLQGARIEAGRRDGTEAKQARAKAFAQAGEQAKQAMRERERIAEDIDAHVTALGPLLAKWSALSATCKDNLWELARNATDSLDRAASASGPLLRIAAGDGGRVPAALTKQLYDAKVGKLGIVVDSQLVEVNRIDTALSVTEAARADTDRIVQSVDQLLGQCMKRLGVQP